MLGPVHVPSPGAYGAIQRIAEDEAFESAREVSLRQEFIDGVLIGVVRVEVEPSEEFDAKLADIAAKQGLELDSPAPGKYVLKPR